ncbi:MAG: 5-formyltetrahydrofolate cyclo-ligase [Bacteroidales bacterium]|nr:5-formyltetrahydrofolate cyclo-ligase [Bacteroidales bacterium]MDD4671297.1 5-formyltetrahydrofolate cyclo-ligase [Bacteroidales bacterium]MDY0348867.1 5-formyltetrahydrofolate cyclo-ligase [Tenuifilaceae bacterium]
MNISEQKTALRKHIRDLKKQANAEEMLRDSAKIFSKTEGLEAFKQAKTVLAYWSMPDEVCTHQFVKKWHKEKTILLPLVVGEVLELKVFSGMQTMVVGPSFGILEPQNGANYKNEPIDFAIIPGVAFDASGNRMGRGKGYYDKLLNKNVILKVGVCFNFQMVEKVPTDSFDIPMDMVVTP